MAQDVAFSSLPSDVQYRIADSYNQAVKMCGGPNKTASETVGIWTQYRVTTAEIEGHIIEKHSRDINLFSETLNLLRGVGPSPARGYTPPASAPTSMRAESPANINVKGDTYAPAVRKVSELSGKLDLRQVETDRPKLSKIEKWSLLVDGKRTLYDTEEEAMESAKRRAKPALLYHHIQEVDDQGIVHHSEDKYIGNVGYADSKSRERVILTFRGSSFASADKKPKKKETDKKRKYYV